MNNIAAAIYRGKMDSESVALFVKHFSHVNVQVVEDEDLKALGIQKHISVQPVWRGVDRPIVCGWSVGTDWCLANRLKKAVESGAVFCMLEFLTDKHGETYIGATDLILGRRMNADLKRLGY